MSLIYLASVDEHVQRPGWAYQAGSRNWLISYYHARTKRTKFFSEVLPRYPEVQVMVDSGAYSFFDSAKQWKKSAVEEYLKKYVDYLWENKDQIAVAVELDVDPIVGWETVKEWEETYFRPLESAGLPILYVWHAERGEAEWPQMCRRHAYVGISSGTAYEKTIFEAGESALAFCVMAKRYCAKTHGFGFTRSESMRKMPFFSVDSSGWLSGERWGMTMGFDRDHITQERDKAKARSTERFRKVCEQVGVSWEDFKADDKNAVNVVSARAFVDFQEFLCRLHGTLSESAEWRFRFPQPEQLSALSRDDLAYWADLVNLRDEEEQKKRIGPREAMELRAVLHPFCVIGNCRHDLYRAASNDVRKDLFQPLFEGWKVSTIDGAQDYLYDAIRPRKTMAIPREERNRFEARFQIYTRETPLTFNKGE